MYKRDIMVGIDHPTEYNTEVGVTICSSVCVCGGEGGGGGGGTTLILVCVLGGDGDKKDINMWV